MWVVVFLELGLGLSFLNFGICMRVGVEEFVG